MLKNRSEMTRSITIMCTYGRKVLFRLMTNLIYGTCECGDERNQIFIFRSRYAILHEKFGEPLADRFTLSPNT